MAGGVTRYRQAYNAGSTGKGLPEGLSSLADSDPMIDSAHDAGRSGTAFEDWQSANMQPPPEGNAPRSSSGRSSARSGARGRTGGRGRSKSSRSSGSLGIRRTARQASVVNPTASRLPIGLTAGAGAAGLFFGAIAYALVLSVVDYGTSGPKLWFKAKFLNEAAGSSSSGSGSSSTSGGTTAPPSSTLHAGGPLA